MEKNAFLVYNDFLYQLNRCQTMEDLKKVFLPQLRLLIPFTHGSYISITRGEADGELVHTLRFWQPDSFRVVEEAWIREYRHAYTAWLSHTAESAVIRDSELMEGNKRFSSHFYRGLFKQLRVRDTMQMNVVSGGRSWAVLRCSALTSLGTSLMTTRFISGPCPITLAWPLPGVTENGI